MRNFVDYYIYYNERLRHINSSALHEPEKLIAQMELRYRSRINEIADFVLRNGEGNKLVMLAGPSGSGKTTTAAMLMERFAEKNVNSYRISLDDFYLPNEQAPLNPDGTKDFESIYALDFSLMRECLLSIVEKDECLLPQFDFDKKVRLPQPRHIKLSGNDVVIVEGIHALNPIVTECLPDEKTLKIYISVKQGIKDETRSVICAHDLRLVRRIIRDVSRRDCSPEDTISMWSSVMRGEKLYINPHKRNADITINSIHIYEPCVLAPAAVPMLLEIDDDSEYKDAANALVRKLRRFHPIDSSLIPENSLLREFIGGGIY
ncbi:MAG: nucleoside kinase [Oscillospiraceae bacterium]|jgi:uridine kinase|nr:nucleoside kinase [Oscillospiraceae bacterium]